MADFQTGSSIPLKIGKDIPVVEQPSLADEAFAYLENLNRSKKVSGIKDNIFKTVLDTTKDLGISPMGLGLAVRGNPALAQVLRDRVKQHMADTGDSFILSYIKQKYPKLAAIPKQIETFDPNFETRPVGIGSAIGVFDPETQTIKAAINTRANPYQVSRDVDTIAHELIHSNQYRKNPAVFSDYFGPEEGYQRYLAQPVEVEARQGGQTAASTFGDVYKEVFKKYHQALTGALR